MAFWTDSTIQPKRNYRFRVNITGFTGNSVVWWAKGFKPPSYEVSEATHDHLDNKFYFPGRVTWGDCSMTLVDPVSPNAVRLTNLMLINSGYKVKDVATEKQTVNKSDAITAGVGTVTVDILDASGTAIETWTLKNAFVKGVSFSDLAYDNDELRTLDITFRYDWAECANKGGIATQFTP